jgi:hypothetical protein
MKGWMMNEGRWAVSEKSHVGDDRGIPPFKKRRVGHPASMFKDNPRYTSR